MEELLVQRQKRIAERTASSGSAHVASRKVPTDGKTTNASTSKTREVNRPSPHKPGSIVPGQIKHKEGSALLKSSQLKSPNQKMNGIAA